MAALLLGVLAAPYSATAAGTGAISGDVTDGATHAGVPEVRVCALPTVEEGEEEISGGTCAQTDAAGSYAISGLAEGGYYIQFGPSSGAPRNYIRQFYDERLAPAEANAVSVGAGTDTPNINAVLQEGGQIAGTITSESTGAPVATTAACAVGPLAIVPLEEFACSITNAHGEYTIWGLPSGGFQVAFIDPLRRYATQYYAGKANPGEAETVTVAVLNLTSHINAVLSRRPPRPPGSGAGAPQPTPGSTTIPSGTLGLPSSRPGQFVLVLGGTTLAVRNDGTALVKLVCRAATGCQGKLTITSPQVYRRGGARLRRNVVIGTARLSIPRGRSATIKVRLLSIGRRMLATAHRNLRSTLAILQLVPAPPRTKLAAVRLVQHAPRR